MSFCDNTKMKVVIVGAGLASAIAVYLLQREYSDVDITIYEKNAIGGLLRNDTVNGTIVQLYGPHVFHTTDNAVRDLMLEIFAKYNIHWETYYDQIFANVDNKLYTLPYSRLTGLTHDEYYHKIIEPYTLKQWGYINEDAINRLHQLNYLQHITMQMHHSAVYLIIIHSSIRSLQSVISFTKSFQNLSLKRWMLTLKSIQVTERIVNSNTHSSYMN